MLIFLAFCVLLAWFFLINDQSLTLSLPGVDYALTLPFYLIISMVFLLGLALGYICIFSKVRGIQRQLKRSTKRQTALEEEIAQLKTSQFRKLS